MCEVGADGFVQKPKRTERGLKVEEVNAVDVVQEIVEITVDSGTPKSVWPIRTKGVARKKATKTVGLATSSGSPIHVEGDARLELVREGKKYNMKFLDADVKRPSGFRERDYRRGKHRRVRTAGIVHREHEHWPEDSDELETRRVCGAAGRTSGYELDEDGDH